MGWHTAFAEPAIRGTETVTPLSTLTASAGRGLKPGRFRPSLMAMWPPEDVHVADRKRVIVTISAQRATALSDAKALPSLSCADMNLV
jgi:hypothetical protein